jgi:hypothetical protein
MDNTATMPNDVGREERDVGGNAREHARALDVVSALDVRLHKDVRVQQQQVLRHVRRHAHIRRLKLCFYVKHML